MPALSLRDSEVIHRLHTGLTRRVTLFWSIRAGDGMANYAKLRVAGVGTSRAIPLAMTDATKTAYAAAAQARRAEDLSNDADNAMSSLTAAYAELETATEGADDPDLTVDDLVCLQADIDGARRVTDFARERIADRLEQLAASVRAL